MLNVEPLGSLHLPNTNLANVRVAKRFQFGSGRVLEARFDFFNVTNANFITSRNLRSGTTTYLAPSAIILPRILQIGASYKF